MHRFKGIRLFGSFIKPDFLGLAVIEAVIIYGSLYLGAALRFGGFAEISHSLPGAIWPRALVLTILIMVSMYSMGLYEPRQRTEAYGVALRIAIGCAVGAVLATVVYYAIPRLFMGRGAHFISAGVAFLLLSAWRFIFWKIVDEEVFKRRVLVFGAGEKADLLTMLRRRSDQRGFSIIGFVPVEGQESKIAKEKLAVFEGSLVDFAKQQQVNEIVVAVDDRRKKIPIHSLLQCRLAGIHVTDVITFFERETGKVRVDLLYPSWMIFSEGFEANAGLQVFKRIFDIVATLIILFFASPLVLITAIAIKIEDGLSAPVLYRQQRTGKNGEPFSVMKFRSMHVDAEKGQGPLWASKNDSRVTRVGSVIRLLRIDELPQLVNVLRGEMSFVGPRPERPQFVDELSAMIPYYQERHCVKPGITGWAQLCYAYGSSVEDAQEKLQYDLYYIKNQSVLFDLQILLQTIEVVLFGKGAR